MGARIPAPTPGPVPHPVLTSESEAQAQLSQLSRTVLGEAQAGSCPRSPQARQPCRLPPPPAPLPAGAAAWRHSRPSRAARGARAPGRGVVGVRAGEAPRRSAGRPSRLPEWAGGAGGPGRREGRGGAGPPPSSFHWHRQGPRPARPRQPPPSGDPLRQPPPHAHPGQLGPHSPSRALCLRLEPPALWDDPSMGTQTQTLSPRRGPWCAQGREGAAQG